MGQRRILLGLCAAIVVFAVALVIAQTVRDGESVTEVQAETIVSTTQAPTTTSTTTTSTTTTTTTTTAAPPRRTAQLVFTGDTLAHRGVVNQAATYAQGQEASYDFGPMFAEVAPILADADLAICHLETPLSADNTNLSGYPTFNVPREMATALFEAGYDGCSFASNHSLDRRPEGVEETLNVLDEVGLKHSGAARSPAEYDEPTIYDAGGISVANLSYSYGFNGFTEPPETPWLVNEINIEEIADEVGRARDRGAEYVVVSLHWGTEYRTEPNEQQLEVASGLAELEGIDIVIGHHAHVVQPIDEVERLPVVFGLGNFLSNQSANCCAVGSQDGVIVQVNIQERAPEDGPGFVTWFTYVPTWVDRSDFTIVPVGVVLDTPNADVDEATRPLLEASRDRTREAIGSLGNTLGVVED